MEISVLQQDLEHVDGLDTDTLLLFLPDHQGPFQGLAGLVDWRLTGRLSRYLQRGWLHGGKGESHLMPAHDRLPVRRLVGIGMGPAEKLDVKAIEDLAEQAGRALAAAKAPSVACSLPGEPSAEDEMMRVFRVLRRGLSRHFDGRLVILGDAKALREIIDEA